MEHHDPFGSDQHPVSQDEILVQDGTVAPPGQNPFALSTPSQDPNLVSDTWAALSGGPFQARWWTPLAVIAVSLAAFIASSVVMTFLAILVVHGTINREVLTNPDLLADVSRSRLGLLIMVVTPQLALVIPSIVAAMLSPEPTRERLGLVRGHWPIWAWIAAAMATPLVGLVSGLVVGIFLEESDTLRQMSDIFRGHGQNGFLIPLALMIGATPALCEELLFRGYVQTRLVKSFGPAIGILVASLAFAAFHMDFVHVIAVFPLGLFLGIVAWRSGSLFPAMLGHFINNVISVVAVVIAPEGQTDVLSMPAVAVSVLVIGTGVLGMAAVTFAAVMYGRPQSAPQTV